MPVTRLLLMTSLIREGLKVPAGLIFNMEMTAAAAAAVAGTEVKYNSRKTDQPIGTETAKTTATAVAGTTATAIKNISTTAQQKYEQ